MLKYILPLLLFIVMAVFLALGLNLNPGEIPSPLINKPAPAFSGPTLQLPEGKLSQTDKFAGSEFEQPEAGPKGEIQGSISYLKGKVWLFNVWASWCASCRSEHPILNQLALAKAAIIVGLNYKDEPEAAKGWLASLGNPYDVSIMDQDGRIGIDWGVYGVPETFVIDKQGVIRYKHTGPVTPEDVQQIFLPLIAKLQAEN